MSTVTEQAEDNGDTKKIISDKYDAPIESESPRCKTERKRFWSTAYMSIATFVGSIVFIVCWFYAYLSWGFWPGVCLGWIPSLLIGVAAGLLWPLVIFILIVYLLFLRYTATA